MYINFFYCSKLWGSENCELYKDCCNCKNAKLPTALYFIEKNELVISISKEEIF